MGSAPYLLIEMLDEHVTAVHADLRARGLIGDRPAGAA
jgi:hypothetical protein